jgi:hypothetical protein
MVCGKSFLLWVVVSVLSGVGCVERPDAVVTYGNGVKERPSSMASLDSATSLRIPDEAGTKPAAVSKPVYLAAAQPQGAPTPSASAAKDPPPPAPPPSAPAPERPADPLTNLRKLYKQAADACAPIDSYIVRLTRREQVGGKAKPEEVMVFKFRKEPFSVYFKWIGKEGNGREVVYVKGQHDGKIYTKVAAGDSPLMAAGSRIALDPNSFLVRRASRHPISEAGISALVDGFGHSVAEAEKGRRTMKYLGTLRRDEFDANVTLEGAEEQLTPGMDPTLPKGGTRQRYFDAASHLPVLVITRDERGQEVEYYRFDRFQYPVKLDDDDFNPDKLPGWPKQ